MTRRLVLSYLLLSALVLVVLEVPLGVSLVRDQRRAFLEGASHDAAAVGGLVEDAVEQGQPPAVQSIARGYAGRVGGRVVVVAAAGATLADSAATGAPTESFTGRPEVTEALHGRSVEGVRYSKTLGYDLAYGAVPIMGPDGVE